MLWRQTRGHAEETAARQQGGGWRVEGCNESKRDVIEQAGGKGGEGGDDE